MTPAQTHSLLRGFTLVEMMVVVAIIAILALMAVPSSQDRVVATQINEALPLADLAKPPVQAAWAASQPLPADNAAASLPAPDKIVSQLVESVTLEQGAIHVVFGNKANGAIKGKTLTLRPAGVEDARMVPLAWLCGAAAAPKNMTAQGTDRTNVEKRFLPQRCRA